MNNSSLVFGNNDLELDSRAFLATTTTLNNDNCSFTLIANEHQHDEIENCRGESNQMIQFNNNNNNKDTTINTTTIDSSFQTSQSISNQMSTIHSFDPFNQQNKLKMFLTIDDSVQFDCSSTVYDRKKRTFTDFIETIDDNNSIPFNFAGNTLSLHTLNQNESILISNSAPFRKSLHTKSKFQGNYSTKTNKK
jgi:hypothetical protein